MLHTPNFSAVPLPRIASQLLGLLLLLVAPLLQADSLDGSLRRGDIEIFYSAFNTSFISPEVARAAAITRGRNKGLVNISVVRYSDGDRQPLEVSSIQGEAYDLVYRNGLDFKIIRETGAIYYLAPFKISNNNEYIQFDVELEVEELAEPVEISFKRRFYLD